MARGLLAALHSHARAVAREAERQHRLAVREHSAALRRMEQARKADERARAMASRAAESDKKRLEKEAKAAHIAAMEAEVEARNSALAETYDAIDGLLAATLGVDDYVDLDTLRRQAVHPPFDRSDLEVALPRRRPSPEPLKPVMRNPEKPGLIFGRWRYKRELAAAAAAHERAMAAWKAEIEVVAERNRKADAKHAHEESERVVALERERARYVKECEAREAEVAAHNASIDALIANLGYGVTEAVHEYVSIVMANSVYPDDFPVRHDFTFDPTTAELELRVLVPPPESLPTTKLFKYSRSADEITETQLPVSVSKERYAGAVHQVALTAR